MYSQATIGHMNVASLPSALTKRKNDDKDVAMSNKTQYTQSNRATYPPLKEKIINDKATTKDYNANDAINKDIDTDGSATTDKNRVNREAEGEEDTVNKQINHLGGTPKFADPNPYDNLRDNGPFASKESMQTGSCKENARTLRENDAEEEPATAVY
jgi:hypothetical protein